MNKTEADKVAAREIARETRIVLRREARQPVASHQCTVTWNPGEYPFSARCIGDQRMPHTTHVSRYGHEHITFGPGTELPLRTIQGADGGAVLVCVAGHQCGTRWPAGNPLNGGARLRQALDHVRAYVEDAEARSVVSRVVHGG